MNKEVTGKVRRSRLMRIKDVTAQIVKAKERLEQLEMKKRLLIQEEKQDLNARTQSLAEMEK